MQSFQYACIVAQDGVRAAGTAHAGKAGYANARYDVIRLEGLTGHKDYQAYQQNDTGLDNEIN